MLIQKQKQNLKRMIDCYGYNFEYLRPPPEVTEITFSEQDQFMILSQGKRRRIYYKVDFSSEELEAIRSTKVKMLAKGIFQKFSDQLVLKHLATAFMNQQKALERLQNLQKLHNDPIITTLTNQTIERLKNGFVYTYGRDKNLRPIIIVRVNQMNTSVSIEQNFNIAYYLMITIKHYMLVPYHCDKIMLFIDVCDLGISQIPYKFVSDIIGLLGLFFCCSTEKTFVFNSGKIGFLWNLISQILPEHARKKVTFVNKGNYDQLFNFISPFECEQRYGGNLKNLKQFWPPKVTSQFDRIGSAITPIKRIEQDSDTSYYSLQENEQFFEESKIACGNCGQCQIF